MVTSVQALYFSPTNGTRKIVSAVSNGINLKKKPEIDLTMQKNRDDFHGEFTGDLLLVGSPVYGGTIPFPFRDSLLKLKGSGKWAVPVAVYGNRSPDTAIEELTKILRERGFKVLAAATFISKHSFAVKEHPWGVGRPDDKDLKAAAEFGRALTEKAKSNPSEISVSDKLNAYAWGFPVPPAGNQVVEAMPEGYHRRVLNRAKSFWSVDSSDRDACDECGSCVKSCPTDAIDAVTLMINEDLCIRCMACVEGCPSGVMKLVYSSKPVAVEAVAGLDKIFAVRKEPKTFL
jgi:ferredoxin